MWRAFEDRHLRLPGVDVAEVVAHIQPRNIGDRPGQLHARWTAADDDELQRRMRAVLQHLPFGQFEGEQHAPAYLGRVFHRLQPGREFGPVFAAKVGVGRPARHDEVVVHQHRAGLQVHVVLLEVEAHGLIHQHLDVGMVAQDGANGLSDVRRREYSQRNLVQQRLKRVVVLAIDQRHIHRQVGEPHCRVDASESTADHDHASPHPAFTHSIRSFIRHRITFQSCVPPY